MKKINDLYEKNNKLNSTYKNILATEIDKLKNEYDYMKSAKNSVKNLLNEKDNLKNEVNREEYYQAKKLVKNLKQKDLKIILSIKLNQIDKILTEKEEFIKAQDEQKKQEEIKKEKELINNSWIKLSVPYISQNLENVHNGCEVSCLLMALKYKGYLQNMDLTTYATNIPKTDNPNTGFYLDIFKKEPKGIAHWIAPQPLVDYGKSSSGYNNIINASGWALEDLSKEIINGNPVIIYLTFNFESPINWSNGVPSNLHVLLLIGYNKISHQYILIDPWYHSSGKYQFTLSKNKLESLYNIIGKKAVIVR